MMHKIRGIVATHYRFCELHDVRPLIIELLENDNFACRDLKKVIHMDI